MLRDFSLKSSKVRLVVDLDSDIGLSHASSFVSSHSEMPSPVVMSFVIVNAISVGGFLFLGDRRHSMDFDELSVLTENIEGGFFNSTCLSVDASCFHLLLENVPDSLVVCSSLISVDVLQRYIDISLRFHVWNESTHGHVTSLLNESLQSS